MSDVHLHLAIPAGYELQVAGGCVSISPIQRVERADHDEPLRFGLAIHSSNARPPDADPGLGKGMETQADRAGAHLSTTRNEKPRVED